jgi:hypothetical protein
LLIQTVAAPVLAGRANAVQLGPFPGIPICGAQTGGSESPGGTPRNPHDGHGLACDCCLAGCCPGSISATLPRGEAIDPPAENGAAPIGLDRTAEASPRPSITGSYARAPPLPL